MSTPHKLNVTFWDKPNNGYSKAAEKGSKRLYLTGSLLDPVPTRIALGVLVLLAAYGADAAGTVLPFLAVAGVHFWHAVIQRGRLTAEMTHALFCASVMGEIAAGAAVSGFGTVVHSAVLLLAGTFLGQEPTLLLYSGCRLFLWATLPWFPDYARAFLCYLSTLVGLVAAKYVETYLLAQILPDLKLSTPKRRRTSNNSMYSVYKMRRTSLPALGASSKNIHHPFGYQGSASTVDVALLAEAHGLVTDMLADPQLPSHVVGGLRSLANLLSPPSQVAVNHRIQRPGGASVSLADFNSGSDNEEIPYTGEKPSALSKRLRRNLPPSILRRMSTSTWTTTTSATGLPTLEPEPSRKRSTSFRHPSDSQNTSPRGGNSPQTGCAVSPSRSNQIAIPSCSKGRSYSTTSIPSTAFIRRNSRDRKTVCSLHPLTSAEIEAFHKAHAQGEDDLQLFHRRMQAARGETDAETTEDDEEGGQPLPPLPCIRRALKSEGLVSSDYESSNESPVSSENNDLLSVDDHLGSKTLAIQTTSSSSSQDLSRCAMCGGKTMHGISVEPGPSRSPVMDIMEDLTPTVQDIIEEDDAPGLLVSGHRYDLEALEHDVLLARINAWDYPIFELNDRAGDLILSQMCYKVFQDTGLFEAFKIPIQEFLNYFHALETGYREKPYHNRMHAADVLQGVYYLTSQPIPGFVPSPPENSTDSPLHRYEDPPNTIAVPRPTYLGENTYGVLGGNYPALELMALYTAAAMHDYDHPGRTNAFMVATYAPQAVLYNDRSVLENHHAAAAWNLFLSRPEFNFLCHLDTAEFKRFRFMVIECILATDLKRHFEIVAEFSAKAVDEDALGIEWKSEADRLLAMEMCIKLADINGPCKRHDIHIQWTHRIAEEFYEQGDEERELGLQVSPYMDRNNPQLAKLQESFISHLVAPLCNAYGQGGLLPGVWEDADSSDDDESSDDDDDDDTPRTEDPKKGNDNDRKSPDPEGHRPRRRRRNRKVRCMQTIHLQENYDYWLDILKREQLAKEMEEEIARMEANEGNGNAEEGEDEEEPQAAGGAAAEAEMETIDEEEGGAVQQRISPSKDDC